MEDQKVKMRDLHVSDTYHMYFAQSVVYYESLKRALKTKTIYGYRCDERLKTNVEESTRLACSYTLVNIFFLFFKKNEPLGGFFTIKA